MRPLHDPNLDHAAGREASRLHANPTAVGVVFESETDRIGVAPEPGDAGLSESD